MRKATISQKYDLSITSMIPRDGVSRPVSAHWIKVDSIYFECNLPYMVLDDIPHLKTRGELRAGSRIEFKSEINEYLLRLQPKEKQAIATFTTTYRGDEYKFVIILGEDGTARVHLEPEHRDYIEYEGSMVLPTPKLQEKSE